MNSALFCPATAATCSAIAESTEPPRIVTPLPIRSFASETAVVGLSASSSTMRSILWPLIFPVPWVT